MTESTFQTPDGSRVPAVTATEMREVDRVAVEDVGLALLQMMENAGRNLAGRVLDRDPGRATVFAGSGGNGGGGLACARHLENRGVSVTAVLDRAADELEGAAATQYRILDETGVDVVGPGGPDRSGAADVAVDALVGYGLSGELRGRTRELARRCDDADATVVSLDVPSGLDATTGDRPGTAVAPDETVTLALPKTGLSAVAGELTLADIAIPRAVYDRAGVEYEVPFEDSYCVPLEISTT